MNNQIKKTVADMADIVKPYSSVPTIIRMKIWTGPALTQDGTIFQCLGYYPEKHIVYAVKGDALKSFNEGLYYIPSDDIDNVKSILNLSSAEDYLNEARKRSRLPTRQVNTDTATEYVGRTVAFSESLSAEHKSLLTLLAFFKKEVHICTVHPRSANNGDKTTVSDVPDPLLNEVEAVLRNGSIDVSNVWFVPSVAYNSNRMFIKAVPRGGGIKQSQLNNRRL